MRLQNLDHSKRGRQSGTAVIVVILILALLLVFITGNIRTLDHLGKELRLLETRQRARIHMPQKNPAPEAQAQVAVKEAAQ